jgi:hypothetical protein
MKFLTQIIIFLCMHSVLGNELPPSQLEEPVDIVIKVNKGELLNHHQMICPNMLDAESKLSKKEISNLYNQCAIDLCGSPEKNKTINITNDNFPSKLPWSPAYRIKRRENILNEVFDIGLKNKIKTLNEIKKALNNSQSILDNNTLFEDVHLASLVFSPYVKTVYHPEEKKIEDRVEVQINYPANVSEEMRNALKEYAANLKQSVFSHPVFEGSNKVFNKEDIASLARDSLDKVNKSYKENPNSLPKEAKEKLEFLNNIFKKDQIREVFEMQMLSLQMLNNEIAKKSKKDALGMAVCKTTSCETVTKNYLNANLNGADFLKTINDYESVLNNPQTKIDAINRCTASLMLKEMKHSDEEKAKVIFLKTKDAYIKNVLPRFSEHSRGIMLNYLNNMISPATENLASVMSKEDPLASFSKDARDYIEKSKDKKSDDPKDLLFKKIISLKDDFDNLDPIDEISPCENVKVSMNAWDAFVSVDSLKLSKNKSSETDELLSIMKNKNKIFISDFSCQNEDHAPHILAHEMSHALNNLILNGQLSEESRKTYDQIRECVNGNHLNAPMREGFNYYAGDSIYTEEDTADAFAVMSAPQDKKIYACMFLSQSLTNNTYRNLKFDGSFFDIHSSGFTRVLFEAANKDIPFSSSCQKLIEQERPKLRFKKCI